MPTSQGALDVSKFCTDSVIFVERKVTTPNPIFLDTKSLFILSFILVLAQVVWRARFDPVFSLKSRAQKVFRRSSIKGSCTLHLGLVQVLLRLP